MLLNILYINIYIGSGQDSTNGFENKFWKYSSILDSWTVEASIPSVGRFSSSAFAMADTGYLGLGSDSSFSFFYNDIYKFYPDTLLARHENLNNEMYISVYPNPNNGVFTLEVKSEEIRANSIIVVYNIGLTQIQV